MSATTFGGVAWLVPPQKKYAVCQIWSRPAQKLWPCTRNRQQTDLLLYVEDKYTILT